MTNIIAKPFVSTKNFLVKHKTALLVTTTVTAVSVVAIQQVAIKQHNEFLADHDLLDEFYALDELDPEI